MTCPTTEHPPLGKLFRQCLTTIEVNLFEAMSNREYITDEEFGDYIQAEVERRMAIADNQVRILLDEQGDHKDWSYALHNPDDWQIIATEQAAYLSRL